MSAARPALHLAAAAADREAWHRRALITGTAALAGLGIGPILGHHFAQGGSALLAASGQIGVLCIAALAVLLASVHSGFHLGLLAGLVYAVCNRVSAWRGMRRLLTQLDAASARPGCTLALAAAEAGVNPARLRIVPWLANPAFTTGLVRPVIYISGDLGERLTFEESVAVLQHEAMHVRRRDPLRLCALRFLADMLFWLPAVRRLADDVADEMEIAADDSAARIRPLALASALLSVATWRQKAPADDATPPGALGFTRHDILDWRVRRLAGEDTPHRSHVSLRSLAAAAIMLMLVWSAGMAASPGGLPTQRLGVGANCVRHAGPAISHIFCPGTTARTAGSLACPHRV